MKVLLYLENAKNLSSSGIGRALLHQSEALKEAGVASTFDPKDSYDIAHINSYFFRSYRLLRKCKKKGIKVIVHGHSTHEDFKNSFRLWKLMAPFYDHWMDRMYSRADLIITPTPYSKGLISGYRNVTCPVIDITNGIVVKDYSANPEFQNEFRQRFDIKDGQKVVVGAGFPFQRKGILDFIEVAKRMPEITFIWFGGLAKILTQQKILKALRHKPKNMVTPGYIKGDIIKGAYQSAACMLFPTYEETEGIVALEALASHCPLIIRDTGVYKDWLTSGINCYKGKSVEDFIDLINKVITSDCSDLTENGYKVASQKEISLTGDKLKKAYQELLETHPD